MYKNDSIFNNKNKSQLIDNNNIVKKSINIYVVTEYKKIEKTKY